MGRNSIARLIILMAVSARVFCFLGAASESARAETRAQFCARWHAVCTQCTGRGATVPRETCLYHCAARLQECRTSGCYFFNVPGPRCQGQAS
jgi:hypothetical protein